MAEAVMSPVQSVVNANVLEQAFLALESEIRAVHKADLITQNLDTDYVVRQALAAAPRLASLRPAMEKLREVVDLALVDKLTQLAHAFWYATGDFIKLDRGAETLAQLYEEGLKLRDLMNLTRAVFDKQGVAEGVQLEQVKTAVGYSNVSRGLVAHVRYFQENWQDLNGKCPITTADLERAAYVAGRLIDAAALKEGANPNVVESSLLRHQALTLLVKAYDEARRAVSCLRWNERDLEVIVPSLYGGKTFKRGEAELEPGSVLPPVGGAAGAVGPSSAPTLPGTPVSTAPRLPVGHPDSDPFTA
jgi:hypothetical protein